MCVYYIFVTLLTGGNKDSYSILSYPFYLKVVGETQIIQWLLLFINLFVSYASAQSDQIRCPHDETLGPQLPIEGTSKTLVRLGGCPG